MRTEAPVPSIQNYLVGSISKHKLEYAATSGVSLLQIILHLATPFLFVMMLQEMRKGKEGNGLPWLLGFSAALFMNYVLSDQRKKIITPIGSELANELGETVVGAYYALPLKRYISPANSSMVGYFGASILRISRAFIDGTHNEIIPSLTEMLGVSILISSKFGAVGAIVTVALVAQLVVLLGAAPRVIKAQNEYMEGLYGAMDDAINQVGQHTSVNIFNAAKAELKRLAQVLKKFGRATDLSILLKSKVQLASGFVYVLSILSVGLFAQYNSDKLSVDGFLGVFMYLNQLAPQLEKLSQAVNELLAEREFFKGTVDYIRGGYDNKDTQKPQLEINTETARIEFRNVSLHYEGVKNPAIQNLSFNIAPGEIFVITGESGAGKTSILSLIEKFYEPTNGEIVIDGKNIAEVSTESVRDIFAVVPQETLLLNLSLRQNVAFANPEATKEEIDKAIELAGLSDVLKKQGDDLIGVGGGKLSGGQRQRVAIARAYVRNAKCFFFDEPTAALDAKTEQEIFSQLGKLITETKRTAIIISHRLASLKYLPPLYKIIVLYQGKKIEEGTYDELMAKKDGLFASQMRVTLAEESLESIKRKNFQSENEIEIVEEEIKPGGSIQQIGLEKLDTTINMPEEGETAPLLPKDAPNPKNNKKKEEGWCILL